MLLYRLPNSNGEEPQGYLGPGKKVRSPTVGGGLGPGQLCPVDASVCSPPGCPFPSAHADAQHLPPLAGASRLGRAQVLRRGHRSAQGRPRLRGPPLLSQKDTAWLPPGRGPLLWASQPRGGSQMQPGPRLAAGRWGAHLHSAHAVAEDRTSLLSWRGASRDPGRHLLAPRSPSQLPAPPPGRGLPRRPAWCLEKPRRMCQAQLVSTSHPAKQ